MSTSPSATKKSAVQKKVGGNIDEPKTVSFEWKKDGKSVSTNYAILCKDTHGLNHRYETHKEVLALGSGFFGDMFDTCNQGQKTSESKLDVKPEDGKVEELELPEDEEFVMALMLSMYNMESALKLQLQSKEKGSRDITSR